MDAIIPHLPLISRIASGAILALIFYGVAKRRTPRVHIPVMLVCFVVDMANVLVIELNRDAIKKSLETAVSPGEILLKVHIAASVICVLAYLVAIATGPFLLRGGGRRLRRLHRHNAVVFLLSRVVNFVTSFWVGA